MFDGETSGFARDRMTLCFRTVCFLAISCLVARVRAFAQARSNCGSFSASMPLLNARNTSIQDLHCYWATSPSNNVKVFARKTRRYVHKSQKPNHEDHTATMTSCGGALKIAKQNRNGTQMKHHYYHSIAPQPPLGPANTTDLSGRFPTRDQNCEKENSPTHHQREEKFSEIGKVSAPQFTHGLLLRKTAWHENESQRAQCPRRQQINPYSWNTIPARRHDHLVSQTLR